MNTADREALRRANTAFDLIRSAYRLSATCLTPAETVTSVRSAITWGMEQALEDAREEADAA